MKTKIFTLVICLPLFLLTIAYAQWTTTGNNIYYTKGNVGIGTTNPATLLSFGNTLNKRKLALWEGASWCGFGIQSGQMRLQIGTPQDRFSFFAGDNTEILTLLGTGRMGIGTTAPLHQLHIKGNPNDDGPQGNGNITLEGWGEPVFNIAGGKNLYFANYDGGKYTPLMTISPEGNIGMGAGPYSTYKLVVEGKIGAREVEVKPTAWADFVFDENNQLKTLSEIESFIKSNKHLPDVPSEKEVLQNGIDLGKMNATLLQKIEELTLYLIEQDKKIEKLTQALELRK